MLQWASYTNCPLYFTSRGHFRTDSESHFKKAALENVSLLDK